MNIAYCNTPESIPKEDHYAIITGSTHHTAADQRSIDYPGHGYPGSTDYYVEYIAYFDKAEWEAIITKYSINKRAFKAIIVKVPTVAMKVSVSVG